MSPSKKQVLRLLLAWSISLSGGIFQIYQVSEQYFRYETVTQLSIYYPKEVVPPKVAACFARDLGSNIFKDIETRIRIEINGRRLLNPKAIILNGTTNAEKYRLNITKFKKNYHECFSLALRNDEPFEARWLTTVSAEPQFFEVLMNASTLSGLEIVQFFLKDRQLDFFGPSENGVESIRKLSNSTSGYGHQNFISLSYSNFKSHLLKHPYKTDCIDYVDHALESQHHCIDSCILKEYNSIFDFDPLSVLTRNPKFKRPSSKEMATNWYRMASIDELCSDKCRQQDCKKDLYVPKIIGTEALEDFGFELYLPIDPVIETKFKPEISLTDFVTYILSCIGFWLGFSPLMFIISFKTTPKKISPQPRRKSQSLSPRTVQEFNSQLENSNREHQLHRTRLDQQEKQISEILRFLSLDRLPEKSLQ